MLRQSLLLAIGFTAGFPGALAQGGVRVPFLFTHHAVLQRDAPVRVWGWAEPNESVTVEFAGQKVEGTAGGDGRWEVRLAPMAASVEQREMRIGGSSDPEPIVVRDVLVGDVWVCSGQSNMDWTVGQSRDGKLETLRVDRPLLRLLEVDQLGAQQPVDDIDKAWVTATPEEVAGFSAVGYYFGAQVQDAIDVPIGLVRNSWGGSACEAWLPLEKFADRELYGPLTDKWNAHAATTDEARLRADYAARMKQFYADRENAYGAAKPLPGLPWVDDPLFHQHRPGNMYYARVAPLTRYAIKGVIWYQGETNAQRGWQYREMFPAMISAWREAWGQGDFPFYWVQLADFLKESDEPLATCDWAELREAQTMTQDRLPNTGEAVIIDLGEANDIHPTNKRDVGLRLARLALANTYGKPLKGRSARFDKLEATDGVATLTLRSVGGGLRTMDGVEPAGFTIAGEDRVFHKATANLVGKDRVELRSDAVKSPVAVRYAWAFNPVVNLYDSEWLPVTPFRTDDWPMVSAGKLAPDDRPPPPPKPRTPDAPVGPTK
ncbi:MAG: sialate O-acetylesterase [Lacipirellulaceae bacterium]